MTTSGGGARRGRPPSVGREQILAATLEVLRERGIARLTTREVAGRAGVSEGSVFYHFGDRFGLLRAVFIDSLSPLVEVGAGGLQGDDVRGTLERFSDAVQEFLRTGLDVLMAAQADADLRESVVAFLAENDYGPHRGIKAVSQYLAGQQAAGAVRPDVDPQVVAHLVVSDAVQRSAQPKLVNHAKGTPSRKAFFDTLMTMLAVR
jgi:AcrR family transcriptional regulator